MSDGFRVGPSARIGHVSLNVSDLDRSLEFYESVLGFHRASKLSDRVLLSAGSNQPHLVELRQVDAGRPGRSTTKRAGLYHFAILLPERKHLADALLNLNDNREKVRFDGFADHLVSEAIYLRDPDFNGVEIYCDRPVSEWQWNGASVRMATESLDTEDLMKDATESGWKSMPEKTIIGHVHLHVRNLGDAMKFYRDALGLSHNASYPGAYFFAAGKYHHHVATNTWLGTAISEASPESVGLDHFAIVLPSQIELDRTLARLSASVVESHPNSVFVRDADGIMVRLYAKAFRS
ncbi:MAG: VOC family protein [Thermodesulfobacteriota bacterium]